MTYISKAITAWSRLINALLLGGSVNETISARAWRMSPNSRSWRTTYHTINKLFFWQNNHCRGAHNNGRREMQQWLDSGQVYMNKGEGIPPEVLWHSAEEVPPVEVGELTKFWIVVLSHYKPSVFVFCASYANRPLLLNEDGELIKPVGWMNEFHHPDFNEYYEPITFNDEYQLLGWAEYVLPIWNGPAL